MIEFLLGGGVKSSHSKGFRAFTLAEVLITLGIIGVVAAMTLPTLIQNHQKAQTVSQLKKSYAVIQQAVELIRADYDGSDMLGMPFVHTQFQHPQYFDVNMFAEEFSKHLNYSERGSNDTYSTDLRMCLPADSTKYYKFASGQRQTAMGIVNKWWILNDGSCIGIRSIGSWTWDDNTHIIIYVDINGSDKNPNQFGKDLFSFELKQSGKVIPNPDNQAMHGCRAGYQGISCAEKIINDGWQIKHDYPWN
ncbi:MAG: type II secretion system protein [Candidatus Gastranaerophilaceae bacterium]|nr:type II secretion system protein [Candidatus Gastranaerophilaceae bacterium]